MPENIRIRKRPSVDSSATAESAGGTRDNTPQVLNPEAPGTSVIGNDLIEIDLSNTTEGYVGARYSGSASRIKIFVITPDSTKYTYDLTASDDWAFLPLTGGDGTYQIEVYGNSCRVLPILPCSRNLKFL